MDSVSLVRRFNRFYTNQIGILTDHVYKSPFSLAETRVLYELAHGAGHTATLLGKELGLDPGYLSRILRDFEKNKLIRRLPSAEDARQSLIALTGKGRKVFEPLEESSANDVRALLERLSEEEQGCLTDAMRTIEELLAGREHGKEPFTIRAHKPGDMGWVVRMHGLVYAREYGWDCDFEAFVAGLVSRFIAGLDPAREHCWIAERGGEIIGAVFLAAKSKRVGQLRMLIVDPSARGLGIGGRLVDECVRFAREAGYSKIMLWTNPILTSARRLYEHAGFRLVKEEIHHSFGGEMVGQTWEMSLLYHANDPACQSTNRTLSPKATTSSPL